MRLRFLLIFLLPLLVLMGCRQTNEPTAENIEIDVSLDTDTPTVGDATLLVTLTTDDGTPVNDATVSVRGDMTHAGMVPVIPDPVSTAEDGVYSIPFEFTMGGDWIITVDVTLANGDTASTDYEIDGVEGDMAMDDMDDDMDMDDMLGEMLMGSAVSGAYMSISNNGEEDLTLVSVSAEGVGMAQIHETTVDENDMASMQEMEDGIVIPAGETVDLAPGGLHIMLMELEMGLIEGDSLALTLEFEDGSTVELDVPIMVFEPEESDALEVDNLSITAYWARPTIVGDSGMEMGMDMEGTEEADMNMEEATEESE